MSNGQQMHLAAFIQAAGHHLGGWRMPDAQSGGENFALIRHVAQSAERAKFDMIFFADAPYTVPTFPPSAIVKLDPLTLLSALAVCTSHIGLVATASTTYTQPFNLARQFASIDLLSGGRTGWNVVTGAQAGAAENFGTLPHPPHDERYVIAAEYLKVFRGLLDSWEDDAIVKDKASGTFADFDKMHPLNHKGKYFSVAGPLNARRPPQGYPVIVQAGASEAGLAFAASEAELIYSVQPDMDAAIQFRMDLRARVEKAGRDPTLMKIMPGVVPIISESEEEAQALIGELGALANPATSMRSLSDRLGRDLSDCPLDGPVPELPTSNIMQGHAKVLSRMAREKNMTLRQLRDHVACCFGHRLLAGKPDAIADGLQERFEAGAADGFVIMPLWFPGPFDRFANEVVPILQKRGLFRNDYTGTTLRDHLGLPRPPHPATLARAQVA